MQSDGVACSVAVGRVLGGNKVGGAEMGPSRRRLERSRDVLM